MSNALETQVGGDHYKNMAIQPVEFCQKNRLNSCESQAIGYICRHQGKNGRQDIEKAIHFLQLLLEIEYPEAKETPDRCDHVLQIGMVPHQCIRNKNHEGECRVI